MTTQPTPHSDKELDEILDSICVIGTTIEGQAEARAAILQWADHRAEKLVAEAQAKTLDDFTTRWNNFIGNMPDKEKNKLGYLELTGMIWGVALAQKINFTATKENKEEI